MSAWELGAAVDGWIAAQGGDQSGKLSVEDEDDLWRGVMARMH